MIYANDIVSQARAWLGKREGNNTHREIIDVYNAHRPLARGYKVKYTDAWCATFVSAVAIKCGATHIIPTECSCSKMITLFKQLGSWWERDDYKPSAGDIVFYDWGDSGNGDNKGSADHVGIVEKVVGNTIYVIEGNYKNSVKVRKIAVNGRYIRGYGIPDYDEAGERFYTVQKGDSLWKIAKIHLGIGPKYTEIKKLNGLKSNTIYAGMVLKIPD